MGHYDSCRDDYVDRDRGQYRRNSKMAVTSSGALFQEPQPKQPDVNNVDTGYVVNQSNSIMRQARPDEKIKSDGLATKYYELPPGAKELNDLIEHKGMNFALANIFKACYRFDEKDGVDKLYDINKMIYFAERLKLMHSRGQL